MVAVADAIWLHNPNAASRRDHLHFVIATTEDGNVAILANMIDQDNTIDSSCLLDAGDHPSVNKPSAIKYLEMFAADVSKIENLLSIYPDRVNQAASENLINRIQQGALKSEFARPDVVEVIKDHLERSASS